MEKVNCNVCEFMEVDNFSCVYSCKKLKCGCHLVESNFRPVVGKPYPNMVPDVGEDKCPGMVVKVEKRRDQ